jgi:modified peptide precursor CbpA
MARLRLNAHWRVRSVGAFGVFIPEERTMNKTQTQQAQDRVGQNPNDCSADPQGQAPTIAVRKSCNPDGIGLSHYVLIDEKKAK